MTSELAQLEKLRDRFRAAMHKQFPGELPPHARASETCPSNEEIWAAVTGPIPHARLGELVDHAVSCASCAESWSLARELTNELDAGETRQPAVVARPRGRWLPMAAAAAVLVTAIGLLIGLRGWKEEPQPPGFRAEAGMEIRSLLPDDQPLSRTDCVLRWSGPPGARYDLLVAGSGLQVIVQVKGLESGEYHVPGDKLAALPATTQIIWRVEAELPDGRRAASRSFVTKLK